MSSSQPAPPSPDDPARPGPEESYREFRRPIAVLALCTGTAGFLDAFAFLRYGTFVANQSGNLIFLGIGPAGWHPAWPAAGASLLAFAGAAGVVSWIRSLPGRWSPALRGLGATALGLSLWTFLNVLLHHGQDGPVSRAVLAAAGGLATGAFTTLFVRTAGVTTTITYQSGTVVKTGGHIVRWIAAPGTDRSRARQASLLGLLTLVCYSIGGGIGAVAQQRPHWVPAWGLLALVPVALLVRRVRAGT
ncbi:YoaK family protein [Micromonospora sp. CA-111912]|uniref:YoaK family protein n=1 Tax=Micromonospora sp. CA-111912 TaxID=3239955 RepID=UPI003D8A3B2F